MKLRIVVLVALMTAVANIAVAGGKKPGTSTGAGWSSAVAISPIGQPDPTRGSQLNDVAVNATGVAIAAWDQFTYTAGGPYTIGVAVQSGGRWGAPFTISDNTTGFSMSPKVAIGADGTMAVSWVYQEAALSQQKMQVAIKSASGAAWTIATLDSGPIGGVAITGFVPVGVDAGGNVTAAWTLWDGTRHVVKAATLPKGGTWSTPTTLSGPTTDGLYLSLAVNPHGDAAVAYTVSPYSAYLTGTHAEYVFRSGPDGAWTTPSIVSETVSSSVGYITNPLVTLDANGLATVVYFGNGVEATRQNISGTWTGPKTVLAAPNPVSSFQSIDLAGDDSGNVIVGASIFDATINVDRASTWVTMGAADGSWGAQERLTDPAVPVDAYATRVAMSRDGALVMVGWIDHYHGTVQVANLTPTGWNVKTIGRGTAFSSFQEVLGLDAAAGNVARAIWKNAKSGTQTMASNYGK